MINVDTSETKNDKYKNGPCICCADRGSKINLSDSAEEHSKIKLVIETANKILN